MASTPLAARHATPYNITQNTLIYGYAGDSTFTPYEPPRPNMPWWDEEQIRIKVTHKFVESQLRNDERSKLAQPLSFGEGLTDYCYGDWVVGKAKKLFLILCDCGVPDQIFALVDHSFDDSDLPLRLEDVPILQLSYEPDKALDRKFYSKQFQYLLRAVKKGEHTIYTDEETVPIEPLNRRPGSAIFQTSEKVSLANKPETVFTRRRHVLGYNSGQVAPEEFLSEIEALKRVVHEHVVSYWASYTYEDCGYTLMTPACELNLRGFLQNIPLQYANLPKSDRRRIPMDWLNCLAGALSFLHQHGYAHSNIRPSNISIDANNNIYLGELDHFRRLQVNRKPYELELYEYGAPENWVRGHTEKEQAIAAHVPAGRTQRKRSSVGADPVSPTPTRRNSVAASSVASKITVIQEWQSEFGDPMHSDIFSMACIYLEIIGFLLKKKSSSFSSHRSVKNKTPGRGGGQPDSSFHGNLGQVESWITILEKEAKKKMKTETLFNGVPEMLQLCKRMLDRDTTLRPLAPEADRIIRNILTQTSELDETGFHCSQPVACLSGWDFGFDKLSMSGPGTPESRESVTSPGSRGSFASPVSFASPLSMSGGNPFARRGSAATRTSSNSGMSVSSSNLPKQLSTNDIKSRSKIWPAQPYAEIGFA